MKLEFVNPGVDYTIKNILEFQAEDVADFWSEPLFYFYPQLDKKYAESLPMKEKTKYIEKCLRAEYPKIKDTIEQKIPLYTEYWTKCEKQIADALSETFEIDCSTLFDDMKCNVTMNPVCPRFLKEQSFDIFYLNSAKGAIGMALHEIIHFVWFHVWNELFGDSYDEYETPSLKWIFSEMVVESIMRDERLSSINPYFPRENGGCIYSYFFDMKANGKNVLQILDDMYNKKSIRDFMRDGYAYCLANEEEIRKHISIAEKEGHK